MTRPEPPRTSSYVDLVGKRWRSFWFTPEPAYTLGLVRIAFGALMVYVTLDLLPGLPVLFSQKGPVPAQPGTDFHWVQKYQWGIFQYLTSDTAILIGWILLLLAAVSLLVGWHSRLAAVLVWVLFLSFIRRNPSVFNYGDLVIAITALILALSACGAALSLDQRRRTGRFWSAEHRARWPVRLMQVELSLIYLFSAQTKLLSDAWNDGSAVSFPWRTFHDWAIVPVPPWIAENPFLVNVATWGTMALEFALALLVWNRRLRYWVLAAGVVMHVLIWLNLSVWFFGLAMFVLYLAWVPWETVRDMPDWLKGAWSRLRRRGSTSEGAGDAENATRNAR
jgi:hypothetical protein